MTRAEKNRIVHAFMRKGYTLINGYCKYCEDGLSKSELIKLGENYTGQYGFNWSLYLHPESKNNLLRRIQKFLNQWGNIPPFEYSKQIIILNDKEKKK